MTAPAIGWALLVIATGAAWMLSGTGWRLPSLPSLFKPGKKSAVEQIEALKAVIAQAQADMAAIVAAQEANAKASAEAAKAAREAAQ